MTEDFTGVLKLCVCDFELRSYSGQLISAYGHFVPSMKPASDVLRRNLP
jgi:hypothetical protein